MFFATKTWVSRRCCVLFAKCYLAVCTYAGSSRARVVPGGLLFELCDKHCTKSVSCSCVFVFGPLENRHLFWGVGASARNGAWRVESVCAVRRCPFSFFFFFFGRVFFVWARLDCFTIYRYNTRHQQNTGTEYPTFRLLLSRQHQCQAAATTTSMPLGWCRLIRLILDAMPACVVPLLFPSQLRQPLLTFRACVACRTNTWYFHQPRGVPYRTVPYRTNTWYFHQPRESINDTAGGGPARPSYVYPAGSSS